MPLLLSSAIKTFLIARTADSYSPSTVAQYEWGLARLLRHSGDMDVSSLTTDHIRSFLAYLQTDYVPSRTSGSVAPLRSASLFAAWKAVRAFYKWAGPEFGIPNPSARIPAPKHAEPTIILPKRDEISALLRACESTRLADTESRRAFVMRRPTAARDKAIVLTLIDTGVRVSELCRLSISECDLKIGEIVIRPIGSGIKSRSRAIPLGAASRKAIAVYLAHFPAENKDPLFRLDDGKGMNRHNVRQMLAEASERAGIRHIHPHLLRHLYGVQFLRNGGSPYDLMRLMGHTSMEQTRKYIQLAEIDNGMARSASVADNWRL